MDEAERVILIDKLYFHEKILEVFIKAIGYGVGLIPTLPHFFTNGIVPTSKGFSKQSFSYCQQGIKIYRSILVKEKQLITEFQDIKTLNQYILRSGKAYAQRKCIGKRILLGKAEEYDSVNNKMLLKYSFGDFSWKTYHTVLSEVENISRYLIDNHYNSNNKFALFANTSPEWLTMTFSLLNISCPIVTVYSSLSDEAIQYAFELTQIQGVMVDEKTLPRLLTFIDKLPFLKLVVVSTYVDDNKVLPIVEQNNHLNFIAFKDIVNYKSETNPQSQEPQNPDDLALIMFTSGSTGIPKGVMISHRNIIAVSASVQNNKYINKHHIYAGFLPSSHVFEFFIELTMMLFGCTIGFCTPLTLLDSSPMIKPGTKGDLVCLKPTLMIAVPLFLERVEKGIIQELKLKSRFKQILFQTCYSIKMFYRYYGFSTPVLDRLVFKTLRNLLGGKIQLAYIGGAYISKSCEEFANICFGSFKQGYGLTETSSAVLFNDIDYLTSGTAGAPLSHCEVKLVPWEEGGCNPNDPDRPSGEIAICGDCVTMGYYKNEELTNASYIIDPDSGKRWFYTGDIGLVMPDGNIKIIDRKKDIVKLLHGEYVSLVKVESQLSSNPLVDIVCVLPNKSMSHLNAIVIPNRERTKKFLIKSFLAQENSDLQAMLEKSEITELISQNIKSTSLNGLNRYEKPHEIHVIADIWTPESNLITPTIKIKRNEITKRYPHLLK